MASLTVKEMREKVKWAYRSPNWDDKVNDMPDKQVAALYYRLLNERKIT